MDERRWMRIEGRKRRKWGRDVGKGIIGEPTSGCVFTVCKNSFRKL
jgi:hypothetical protein